MHMHETIITPRQQKILDILATQTSATRAELAKILSPVYPVSKPTLARDLKALTVSGRIKSSGVGRSTSYRLFQAHSLLRHINLAQYFELEPDQRLDANKRFNPQIFPQLLDLFTSADLLELQQIYKPLPKNPNFRELERFVIELSWKSSKIEGNTYTLLETESLIKDARKAAGKPSSEAMMILNHKAAFETILNHPSDFTDLKLTTLLQLHNRLISGLGISGGIRTTRVGITGTAYIPPDNQWQLTEYLNSTIECINRATHPLEKALIASAMIAYLQPFADGNKRTARMLTNALLIAQQYYPLSYRSVDENEYKQALIVFFETNNLLDLKRLFIDQYRFALETYNL